MKNLYRFFSQSGFSMAEAAIGGALVAGLAVTGMQLAKMASGNQKASGYVAEAKQFTLLIRNRLAYPDACRETFNSLNTSSVNYVDNVLDDAGNVVYAKNAKYDSLRFLGLTLHPPGANDTTFVIPGQTGMLYVTASFRGDKADPSARPLVRKFKTLVRTNASGEIINCSAILSSETEYWERNVDNYDRIYYAGGNVGARHSSPAELMDTSRNAQARTTDGQTVFMGGNETTTYQLSAQDNRPFVFQHGVNPVNIVFRHANAQQVKLGTTGLGCSASTAGALRRHPSLGVLQLCTGAYWATLKDE